MENLEHPKLYCENNTVIELKCHPFIIGRGLNCDYIVPNKVVSREHCKFEKKENQWVLIDTSSNGTYLNGNLIHKASSPLKDCDSIQLSADLQYTYRFRLFPTDNITDEQLCIAADSVLEDLEVPESNTANSHKNLIDAGEPPILLSDSIIITEGSSAKRIKLTEPMVPNNVIDLTEDCSITDMPSTSTNPPVIDLSESFQVVPSTTSDLKIVIQKISNTKVSSNLEAPANEPSTSEIVDDKVPLNTEEDSENPVDDELLCSICSEMFVKASTLSCSHTFCKYCINTWKAKQSMCPICRAKITSQVPTLVLDNVIEKIVQTSSKSVQDRRKELLAERKDLDANTTTATSLGSNQLPIASVTIDSNDEDDDDTYDSTASINSDELDEEDYWNDDWYNQGNRRRPYYGGYGRCYVCQRQGHWANSCPFR